MKESIQIKLFDKYYRISLIYIQISKTTILYALQVSNSYSLPKLSLEYIYIFILHNNYDYIHRVKSDHFIMRIVSYSRMIKNHRIIRSQISLFKMK